MAEDLRKGTRVSWNSSGGTAHGKVVRKQTTPTRIKGHKVAASAADPQYVVETDEADVAETYGLLVDALRPLGLAYLSVLHADPTSALVQDLRARFGGHLMINDGFGAVTTREDAETLAALMSPRRSAVGLGGVLTEGREGLQQWRIQ